ncbi:HLA class II histocompatibility antigen, DP beta 1 chain-like [Nerophis ophidion]|uniref:HLA class II histocompatibility antigen, DP beta 1 chain-like n=1 Tax=Nerophis ophidion TaxID=159077 RepID=UPI002ADF1F86|nr:HLA class II histocompatibility antigen, DP beta 1 chain-like [Nerophis ophidion]
MLLLPCPLHSSSTSGKFVGYTEYGIKTAAFWNANPDMIEHFRSFKELYCKGNVDIDYQNALTKSVKPSVRLHSQSPPGGPHSAMLVCSVYDFYPKHIRVTWQRNRQEVTSNVTSTDELADGDWYYQIHSQLVYTPRPGDKISCVLEQELLCTKWGNTSHTPVSLTHQYLSVTHLSDSRC